MADQLPFGADAELATNPEPRCPCVLLLDVSGSMGEVVADSGRDLEFPTNRGQRESGVLLKHEETHRWPVSASRTRRSSSSRR